MHDLTKPERAYLIGATVLSTVTLVGLVLVLPLTAFHVQWRTSELYALAEECEVETANLWREVTRWEQKSRKRRENRPWVGNSCCTCQQGPRGPAGRPGRPGADGKSGPQGPLGRNGRPGIYLSAAVIPRDEPCQKCPPAQVGSPGLPGLKGERGPAGTPGEPGIPGQPGVRGVRGPLGPTGAAGAQGPPGPVGDPGRILIGAPQGPAGPPGPIGPRGRLGVAGPDGAPGLKGPRGHAGEPGERGADGVPGAGGPRGAAGQPGRKGGCGHCAPQDAAGLGAGLQVLRSAEAEETDPTTTEPPTTARTVPIRVYGAKTVTKSFYMRRRPRP